jgi:hypothetical protein
MTTILRQADRGLKSTSTIVPSLRDSDDAGVDVSAAMVNVWFNRQSVRCVVGRRRLAGVVGLAVLLSLMGVATPIR